MFGFLLFLGGLLAAVGRREKVGTIPARQKLKLQIREIVPPRATKAELEEQDPPPGICTWGEFVGDIDRCYWIPMYLKTQSRVDVRWGACVTEWVDDIGKYEGLPGWTRKVDDVMVWIANIVAAGAGDVAKWLTDRICFRMKWEKMRAYRFAPDTPTQARVDLGVNYYAVDRRESGILLNAAPPFPPGMVPREGYKRVWVARESSGAAPMTRSAEALIVFWPPSEEGGPVVQELLTRTRIRDMLRMDPRTSGSINAKQLARQAEDGKGRWWLARRSKAREEYR